MTKISSWTIETHPGLFLRKNYVEKLGLSVSELAIRLQMQRGPINDTLNGKQGIGTRLAIRLEMLGIETAETWYVMQARYDLAQARLKPQPSLERIT